MRFDPILSERPTGDIALSLNNSVMSVKQARSTPCRCGPVPSVATRGTFLLGGPWDRAFQSMEVDVSPADAHWEPITVFRRFLCHVKDANLLHWRCMSCTIVSDEQPGTRYAGMCACEVRLAGEFGFLLSALLVLALLPGPCASAPDESELTPLAKAARNGDFHEVKRLVDDGADVNSRGTSYAGSFPLTWACWNGNPLVVKLLLERGADVNAVDPVGGTALMQACRFGRVEVVALLLERGARVNARNNSGMTALKLACINGTVAVVKLLLERGADVNAPDRSGFSGRALTWASWKGHAEVVRLLLAKGADVNATGPLGWTALMHASARGHLEAVRALLESGAKVNLKNSNEKTALDLARSEGHGEVVRLLRNSGAKK